MQKLEGRRSSSCSSSSSSSSPSPRASVEGERYAESQPKLKIEQPPLVKAHQSSKSEYTRLCEIEAFLKAGDSASTEMELQRDLPRIESLRKAMRDLLEQVQEIESSMRVIRTEKDECMLFGIDPESGMVSGTVPSGPYYDAVNNFLQDTMHNEHVHPMKDWMKVMDPNVAEEYRRRVFIQSSCTINDPRKLVSRYQNIVLFYDQRGVEYVLQEIAQLNNLFGNELVSKIDAMSALKTTLSSAQRAFIDILQKYPREHKRATVLQELPRVQKLLNLYKDTHLARQKRFEILFETSLISKQDLIASGKAQPALTRSFMTQLTKSVTAQQMQGASTVPTLVDTENATFKKAEKDFKKNIKKDKRRNNKKPLAPSSFAATESNRAQSSLQESN